MTLRKLLIVVVLVLAACVIAPAGGSATAPIAHAAATCDDYPNQAAAQKAADTRDADGDGIYCESLSCPCSSAAGGSGAGSGGGGSTPAPKPKTSCTTPRGVQSIYFSRTKYPHIRAHFLRALRKGWPGILVVNRPGASERRDRLLAGIPTRAGDDRDEYPPATGRGRGPGLTRGLDPLGWRADVEYVGSHENRSHGSVLGSKLRGLCDGTKFRYAFY